MASRLNSFVRLDRAVLAGARTETEMIDSAQQLQDGRCWSCADGESKNAERGGESKDAER